MRKSRLPRPSGVLLYPFFGILLNPVIALAERVREYGYLAGIAVLAVVVGGAALFLANPAHQTPEPMSDHAGTVQILLTTDETT